MALLLRISNEALQLLKRPQLLRTELESTKAGDLVMLHVAIFSETRSKMNCLFCVI
jgi:hypothetical protein